MGGTEFWMHPSGLPEVRGIASDNSLLERKERNEYQDQTDQDESGEDPRID